MGWREERVARNETLFREVNERIKQVNAPLATAEEADFLCECGDQECTEPISLTVAEYEAVRREATHFAVSPGHVFPEIEVVVTETERYTVVAKVDPDAAEAAEARDPRS
ncbi:MAG TPA: hypothetical protein VK915_12650 [Gaiellaceae bacterium]|nr:hypothetical protein [Gaiellaceae bacterium]